MCAKSKQIEKVVPPDHGERGSEVWYIRMAVSPNNMESHFASSHPSPCACNEMKMGDVKTEMDEMR